MLVHSMTGFGRAVGAAQDRTLSVEIRTVNHRYLDVRVRLPAGLLVMEDRIRRRLAGALARGRVECTVTVEERGGGGRALRVDESLLQSVAAALHRVRDALDIREPLRLADLAAFSELWYVEAEPLDEQAVGEALDGAVDEALQDVLRMRREEGAALAADVRDRIDNVARLRARLAQRAPGIVAEAQARLTERIEALLGEQPIDPDRLAQEAALLADRADVSEELTRIGSHLEQLRARLRQGGPVGRTLDFLLQELNREWNTVGSKIHDAEAAHVVVQARAELEKMREQVQNLQ